LDLGRGAVDLVGRQQLVEDPPLVEAKAAVVRVLAVGVGEIGGQQVQRESDMIELSSSPEARALTTSVLASPKASSTSRRPPANKAISIRTSLYVRSRPGQHGLAWEMQIP